PGYRSPWTGEGGRWEGVQDSSKYVYSGGESGKLVWNGTRPLTDRNSYNQAVNTFRLDATPTSAGKLDTNYRPFYVSDIAMSADITMTDGAVIAAPVVKARGREFRAVVDAGAGAAGVEMRVDGAEGGWTVLDAGTFAKRGRGDVLGVEFWHIDQALWLFIDGDLVCGGPDDGAYAMTPVERAVAVTGMSREALEDQPVGDGVNRPGVLSRPEIYKPATIEWGFEGGGMTLSNVRVRRDISYKNMSRETTNIGTRGGHPDFFPTLSGEEFFMCGDNSARSLDSRLWEEHTIVPWVAELIDDRAGTVNRDLIVGKAFVVYWPSTLKEGPVLAPDIGRVRWIW
ncbi:MAG: S26 family signal peptidase, partial [Phycisphaerales bacterium]